MSDMNMMYSNISASSKISEQTITGVQQQQRDVEGSMNKSILQSYFDRIRSQSDERTQKLMKEIENAPYSQVSKLFGNLEIKSADQIGRLFDDLKAMPTEQVDKLIETLRADNNAKAGKSDEPQENYLQKFFRQSTENLSKAGKELNDKAKEMSEAAKKLEEAIKEKMADRAESNTAYDAAKDFVGKYNSVNAAIKDAKVGAVSGKAEFIGDMTKAYANRLEKVGITQNEDGSLSVDKAKFEAAGERDLERAFGEKDSFAQFIDGQAKQLSAFAQNDLFQRASAYNNGGNINAISEINGSYFNMLG